MNSTNYSLITPANCFQFLENVQSWSVLKDLFNLLRKTNSIIIQIFLNKATLHKTGLMKSDPSSNTGSFFESFNSPKGIGHNVKNEYTLRQSYFMKYSYLGTG